MTTRTAHGTGISRVELSDDDQHLLFWVQRELLSPNRILGSHWRVFHAEKIAWRDAFVSALVGARGAVALQRLDPRSGVLGARGVRQAIPRRLTITRLVPRPTDCIRDLDNLWFAGKHLVDALVSLGLIYDDAPAWLERQPPRQDVSIDHSWWTIVELRPHAANH